MGVMCNLIIIIILPMKNMNVIYRQGETELQQPLFSLVDWSSN